MWVNNVMGQYITHRQESNTCVIAELLNPMRRRMFNFLDSISIAIISFSLGYIIGTIGTVHF